MGENNETVKIAFDVEVIEEMQKKIDYLEKCLEDARRDREFANLAGEIKGLKFAIRCNGVSGAEVRQ